MHGMMMQRWRLPTIRCAERALTQRNKIFRSVKSFTAAYPKHASFPFIPPSFSSLPRVSPSPAPFNHIIKLSLYSMSSTPILPQDTTIQSTLPIIDAKGGLEVTAIGEVRYQRGYYTRTEVFPVGYTARRKHRSVYGLGFGVQGLGLRVPCRMNGSPQAQVGSFSASPGPSTDSCIHS